MADIDTLLGVVDEDFIESSAFLVFRSDFSVDSVFIIGFEAVSILSVSIGTVSGT